jgi:hypothetical protein
MDARAGVVAELIVDAETELVEKMSWTRTIEVTPTR